jgi:hypothetical protein
MILSLSSPETTMAFTSSPRFTSDGGYQYEYEPSYYVSTLDWFNIARCARERMTENAGDIHRWRGERRSFYTSIQAMNANSKYLLD